MEKTRPRESEDFPGEFLEPLKQSLKRLREALYGKPKAMKLDANATSSFTSYSESDLANKFGLGHYPERYSVINILKAWGVLQPSSEKISHYGMASYKAGSLTEESLVRYKINIPKAKEYIQKFLNDESK